MNSVEAYKGFITFLILGSIVGLSVLGFNLINKSSNTESSAKEDFSDPQNIQVEFLSQNEANISWETVNETQTEIAYSYSQSFSDPVRIKTNSDKTKTHRVNIAEITRGKTYYYKIIQSTREYPLTETPYSFTSPDLNSLAPVIREINEDQLPLQSAESTSQTTTDIESTEQEAQSKASDDFGGFESSTEYNPNNQVLGKQSYVIGENIAKEFKEASLYQDMRYDFNQDSKVDTNDYPLFINFILNQED